MPPGGKIAGDAQIHLSGDRHQPRLVGQRHRREGVHSWIKQQRAAHHRGSVGAGQQNLHLPAGGHGTSVAPTVSKGASGGAGMVAAGTAAGRAVPPDRPAAHNIA